MIAERSTLQSVSLDGKPRGWWGPIWSAPQRRSLQDLVSDGVLDPVTAALLWTVVELGSSLTVAAGPSGAGKTTLLTSLLDAIPASKHRRYVGGIHDQLHDLESLPVHDTVLLVNEISPHLPAYCWGPALRRLLEAGSAGYQVLATIHAGTADELVSSLNSGPLRLPLRLIAALGTVVLLDAQEADGAMVRRVRSLALFDHDRLSGGIVCSECDSEDTDGLLRLARQLAIEPALVLRRAAMFAYAPPGRP